MKTFVFSAFLAVLVTSVDAALRQSIVESQPLELEWVKSDGTARNLQSSETFEKGKLRVRSAGVCIGVPYGKTATVAITAVGYVRLL